MVIAVVGDISAGKVKRILKEKFGGWYKVQKDIPDLPELSDLPNFTLINDHSNKQSDAFVLFGHRSPTFSDADYPAFRVLASLLNSPTRFGLSHHLREQKGFSYNADADWMNLVHTGVLVCGFTCEPENVSESLEIAIGCMERLRNEPVPPERIQMVATHFKNRTIIDEERESTVAYRLAFAEFFGLDYNYVDQWNTKIAELTPEKLQQTAKKLLHPDKLQIVISGDKTRIGDLSNLRHAEKTSSRNP